MRESRTSGSVGDPGGNARVYPTIFKPSLKLPRFSSRETLKIPRSMNDAEDCHRGAVDSVDDPVATEEDFSEIISTELRHDPADTGRGSEFFGRGDQPVDKVDGMEHRVHGDERLN